MVPRDRRLGVRESFGTRLIVEPAALAEPGATAEAAVAAHRARARPGSTARSAERGVVRNGGVGDGDRADQVVDAAAVGPAPRATAAAGSARSASAPEGVVADERRVVDLCRGRRAGRDQRRRGDGAADRKVALAAITSSPALAAVAGAYFIAGEAGMTDDQRPAEVADRAAEGRTAGSSGAPGAAGASIAGTGPISVERARAHVDRGPVR